MRMQPSEDIVKAYTFLDGKMLPIREKGVEGYIELKYISGKGMFTIDSEGRLEKIIGGALQKIISGEVKVYEKK